MRPTSGREENYQDKLTNSQKEKEWAKLADDKLIEASTKNGKAVSSRLTNCVSVGIFGQIVAHASPGIDSGGALKSKV